jgi:hypothetical protein
MRYRYNPYTSSELERLFPFRQNNRRPDGFWNAEDATRDNIKGTSVDPSTPVWPRWRETPPLHGEGEFISHEPFFDIDEITQRADFYPTGRPLVDRNVDGHPASRQRVNDTDAGNLRRRRLLVAQPDKSSPLNPASDLQGSSRLVEGSRESHNLNPVGIYAGETAGVGPSSPGTVDMYLGFVPLAGGAYHAYNIISGPNGDTYAVRGGPMNGYGDPGKSSGGLAAGYDVLSNSVGPETFGNLTAEDDGEGLKYDRNNTVGRYYIGSVNMPYETAVDRLKAFRDSVNNAMV